MFGRGLIINLIWIFHKVSCKPSNTEPGLRINKIIDENQINIDFTLPGAEGFSDTMILKSFFSKASNNVNDPLSPLSCNYVGHLLSDKNSAVSLSGCLFREDVTTTITSSKYPIQSHLWKLYGAVEELNMDNVMNPPKFKVDKSDLDETTTDGLEQNLDELDQTIDDLDQNLDETTTDSQLEFETSTDSQSEFESSTDDVQDDFESSTDDVQDDFDDENTNDTNDIPIPQESIDLEYCALRLKGNIKGLIPPDLTFKITANYEDTFLESFNNDKAKAEASIMEAITQAQPMFLDPTLGTRVHLKLVGEFTHFPGERLDSENGLDRSEVLFEQANSSLLLEATHVMFVNDSCVGDLCTSVGIAMSSSVCYGSKYGTPSVTVVERQDSYGWLLSHELGHVLGMDHNWAWEKPSKFHPDRPVLPEGYCNDAARGKSKISHLMRNFVVSKRRTWSICNRCDVLKLYQEEMIKYGEYCLISSTKSKGSFSTLK